MATLRDIFKSVEDWARRALAPPKEHTFPQAADSDYYSDAAKEFINTQKWHYCDSSHHKAAWYDLQRWEMHFWAAKSDQVWTVEGVSPTEAVSYFNAPSRGIWYWDNVNVRGKGNKGKTKKKFHYGM